MARVDVFVRSYCEFEPKDHWASVLRRGMRMATLARWHMFPKDEVRLTVLHSSSFREFESCFEADYISLYGPTMHMDAKKAAERLAHSEVYVVADDDCLPIGRQFVSEGIAAMLNWEKYGILTATSIDDAALIERGLYVPPPLERHAVGGVAFIRKGILADFDKCAPDQVDGTICDEFKRRGWKSGVMPWVKFNHLGAHYSISTKGVWAA